jgi:predicted HTH transcriptional regulator
MDDLIKLISKGENEILEFKVSLRLEEEIGQSICAFSNSGGGLILAGVTDAGTIVGIDVGKNTLEELANYIKRNTNPGIFPSMKIADIKGKRIIMIEVKESSDKPVLEELGLNKRQIKAIDFINEHTRITTKDYCSLFKVARDTANRDLNELLKKGIIIRNGSGP